MKNKPKEEKRKWFS